MDLPVWQALYRELEAKNFVPIAVAFDSAGNPAAEPWIKVANPSYPCLIDTRHLVAELYDMVNVSNAVWIDEHGKIVRPTEPAGVTDSFRTMDRKTFTMPQSAIDELTARRAAYQNALRDWAEKGASSKSSLGETEVLRRM